MKTATKSSLLFVSSLVLLVAFSPAIALSGSMMTPAMAVMSPSNVGSYNWSGYAVSTSSVTFVSGSWIVPTVTSPNPTSTTTYYAAFWLGIDGFTSNTVEQTGILAEAQGSGVTWYAFTEFYPSAAVLTSEPTISVGDLITANVTYTTSSSSSAAKVTDMLSPITSSTFSSNKFPDPRRSTGTFTVSIKDGSKWSISKTGTVANAARSSAECIAETPTVNGKLASLADFGTANFTNCDASTTTVATQAFGSFSSVYAITMYNYPSANTVMALPSALTSSSFSVTWESAGP